jgi:SAM-dependent methyltransferase
MTRLPKPECWAQDHASAFNEETSARAYHLRPPYPRALIATLGGLVTDEPRTILDLGCGPGDLARQLVDAGERVDALDRSAAMVEQGRAMENGNHPRLRWIVGPAEDAPLEPPYALVTAGDSLHWMDWDVVLPRVRDVLTPNGLLAVAGRGWGFAAPEEREIVARYSTNRGFRPLNVVEELESRGLFHRRGAQTWKEPWTPTIDEYIGSNRSRAGYPTDPEQAEAFEREIRALIERLVRDGRLEATGERLALTVTAGVAWGVPWMSESLI